MKKSLAFLLLILIVFLSLYETSFAQDEQILFASTGRSDGGRFLRIDAETGAATVIGSTGFPGVPAIAVNSLGEIFGVSTTSRLFRIDSSTGLGTDIASSGLVISIAFDLDDILYGGTRTGSIFAIDVITGALTPVVSTPGRIDGMSFNPLDNALYLTQLVGSVSEVRKIDISTGDTTLIGAPGFAVPDIAFDSAGILYGVRGGGREANNRLFTLDLSTGEVTEIGFTGFTSVAGLSFFRVPVEIIAGDVSGDGIVDVTDLIGTINIILAIGNPPTEQEQAAADVNGDGMIDVTDLIAIINIILGLG